MESHLLMSDKINAATDLVKYAVECTDETDPPEFRALVKSAIAFLQEQFTGSKVKTEAPLLTSALVDKYLHGLERSKFEQAEPIINAFAVWVNKQSNV